MGDHLCSSGLTVLNFFPKQPALAQRFSAVSRHDQKCFLLDSAKTPWLAPHAQWVCSTGVKRVQWEEHPLTMRAPGTTVPHPWGDKPPCWLHGKHDAPQEGSAPHRGWGPFWAPIDLIGVTQELSQMGRANSWSSPY